MPVYELINPSDPYTFVAPNITLAGVAVAMLSTSFGATQIDPPSDDRTPVLFGWDQWLKDQGVDEAFINANRKELADVYDSFLIGHANDRQDTEDMLSELPEEKRAAFKARRQGRHRTSLNRIGEVAYGRAKALRELLEKAESK